MKQKIPKYIEAFGLMVTENDAYLAELSKAEGDADRQINCVIVHDKIRQLLMDAPAEDVVRVVRCENCAFYHRYYFGNNRFQHRCYWWLRDTEPKDFCCHGREL